MLESLQSIGAGGLFQILVLAAGYYYIFLFLRGTRGAQVLVGLAFLLAILTGLTQLFNLDALNWILRRISVFFGAALLIIFQPEIRRALAELGRQPLFAAAKQKREVVESIVEATLSLAEQRIGALVAVERDTAAAAVIETGVSLDAAVTPELLASIFFPHTPLHDGGVIIRGGRIVAAGCVFPLSQKTELHRELGTRHRAALGLSEETDAVVVVVSEETGAISVSYQGRISRGLDEERLRRFLSGVLVRDNADESRWQRMRKELDLTPEGIAKSENLAAQEENRGA